MNFFVENVGAEGIRFGKWIGSNGAALLQTPGCMLYTRTGGVPSLGADLLEAFPNLPAISQLSLSSIYGRPSGAILQRLNKTSHTFYSLDKLCAMSYLTIQDHAEHTDASFNENKTVSIWTDNQRIKLCPEDLVDYLKASQPDVFECLCDSLPSSTPASAKRAGKSVDRTLSHLDKCLEYQQKTPELQRLAVFGVVEGGSYVEQRVRSAKETANRPVAGFAFGGLDIGDDSLEIIAQILLASMTALPADKPRLLHGPVSPEDILRLVECGVDVFDSSYVYLLAENGLALHLLPEGSPDAPHPPETAAKATPLQQPQQQDSAGGRLVATRGEVSACAGPGTATSASHPTTSGGSASVQDSQQAGPSAGGVHAAIPSSAANGAPSPTASPPHSSRDPAQGDSSLDAERHEVAGPVAHPDFTKRRQPVTPLKRAVRPFEMDLAQKRYVDDFRALSPNCSCPACSGGCTRAYVYHLLNEGELLAHMHLMQHNLYHYLAFFEAVRSAASIANPEERATALGRLRRRLRNSVVV